MNWPNQPSIRMHRLDLAILTHEPAEAYHAKTGQYLTAHTLADFCRCPLLFQRKQDGLVEDRDSTAYLVGRAAHTLILEGREQFEQEFAVGGPINPTTGRPYGANTKAFAEWAHALGKPVLTQEQLALIESMVDGVNRSPAALDLLAEGQAEGVVRTRYCDALCQTRMDWLNPRAGIVDLKTCDDLTWFEMDARRYGYQRQMAFYRAVLAYALGGQIVPVHIIAIEKKQPFRCGVWKVSEDTLAVAQRENEAAIRRLAQCRANDRWPTGYEEIRVLNVT